MSFRKRFVMLRARVRPSQERNKGNHLEIIARSLSSGTRLGPTFFNGALSKVEESILNRIKGLSTMCTAQTLRASGPDGLRY
jgi:hypothetical protein